jgi:hypothetical protein
MRVRPFAFRGRYPLVSLSRPAGEVAAERPAGERPAGEVVAERPVGDATRRRHAAAPPP